MIKTAPPEQMGTVEQIVSVIDEANIDSTNNPETELIDLNLN
jgi:hypothetical protein